MAETSEFIGHATLAERVDLSSGRETPPASSTFTF
jgi:hypothetical protein